MFTGKKEAVILSALAGAAIAASVEGFENAKKTNIPVLIKEGDSLVEVQPDGSKRVIRKLSKTETAVPKKFKLS